MWIVALPGTRTYLALDASCVTAAEVSHGVKTARLRTLAREPLAPGALMPGPAGANLADEAVVHAALVRVLERVARERVTLVLPDGLARLALLETPSGVDAREYVRFRLSSALPWPAADASVDTLAAGGSRVVGAAIGRASVAEYEQAAPARRCTRCSGTWRSASPSCARERSWGCAAAAATARAARPRAWPRRCDGSRPRAATATRA